MVHDASMLAPSVTKAVRELRCRLEMRFGARLREVVVFGSYARGEAHEESDVDLLVVVDDLTEAERRDVVDFAYDVDRAQTSWLGISPLPLATAQANELRQGERRLMREIDSDGIAL